jgi:pyrroline-5-carboxylate reductase
MSTIVFLGGGRITSALLAGLRLAKTRHKLIVHDRNPAKLRALKRQFAVEVEPDLAGAVRRAELLIIAVRPDSVPDLLSRIATLKPATLAVSLAAGFPLRNLQRQLGPPVRWARAMPSPASRSRRGLAAVTFSRNASARDRKLIRGFFAEVGQVVEVPERTFDAFTITYSASHGYHALATLAGAAQKIGLDRNTALLAAAHALADGILAWREGTHSLEALLDEAATPGGIAATAMAGANAAGYQRAVRHGLQRGLRRTRANARFARGS